VPTLCQGEVDVNSPADYDPAEPAAARHMPGAHREQCPKSPPRVDDDRQTIPISPSSGRISQCLQALAQLTKRPFSMGIENQEDVLLGKRRPDAGRTLNHEPRISFQTFSLGFQAADVRLSHVFVSKCRFISQRNISTIRYFLYTSQPQTSTTKSFTSL